MTGRWRGLSTWENPRSYAVEGYSSGTFKSEGLSIQGRRLRVHRVGAFVGGEKLQTELNEGPCIVSYRSGEAVAISDLRKDRRFPLFAPGAVVAGLSAVFTFPLR